MYVLRDSKPTDVTFSISAPTNPQVTSAKPEIGQNKDVLYISLSLVILILLAGLWLLYSHYIKTKKTDKFGYSI